MGFGGCCQKRQSSRGFRVGTVGKYSAKKKRKTTQSSEKLCLERQLKRQSFSFRSGSPVFKKQAFGDGRQGGDQVRQSAFSFRLSAGAQD